MINPRNQKILFWYELLHGLNTEIELEITQSPFQTYFMIQRYSYYEILIKGVLL